MFCNSATSIDNNLVHFHLWWGELMLKPGKVQDCTLRRFISVDIHLARWTIARIYCRRCKFWHVSLAYFCASLNLNNFWTLVRNNQIFNSYVSCFNGGERRNYCKIFKSETNIWSCYQMTLSKSMIILL